MANVCLVWLVFSSTHSAIDVGLVAFTASVGTLVASLPAGTFVDRFNRRWLLFLSHAMRGVVFGILVVLVGLQGFRLDLLVALVLAWSAIGELYRSTNLSILPDLIDARNLPDANGIQGASTSAVGALSSALAGGLIVSLGVEFGFIYSVAAYGAAAILAAVWVVPRRSAPSPRAIGSLRDGTTIRGMARDLKEGFRWLLGEKGLWQLSISAAAFNFLFGVTWPFFVVYVATALRADAIIFGGMLAAYAAGQVVGSVLVGRTRALSVAGKVWILLYGGISGLLLLILGLLPNPVVAITANLILGSVVGFAANVWLTSAQNIVPTGMRGRYFAIDGVLTWVGGPPAIATGALLIQALGVSLTFELAGISMMISALVFGLMKSLWTLDGRSRAANTPE